MSALAQAETEKASDRCPHCGMTRCDCGERYEETGVQTAPQNESADWLATDLATPFPFPALRTTSGPSIQRQPNGTTPDVDSTAASEEAAGTSAGTSAPGEPAPAVSEPPASESAGQPVAGGLIVEDDVDPGPGQMRKTEFLDELRDAVSGAAEEALSGTSWSAAGWIEQWFGGFNGRDSAQVERAIRRYVPGSDALTDAAGYIPAITARVRSGIRAWSSTGEVPVLPPEAAEQIQAASGEAPAISRKAQAGAETVPAASPAAVRAQLGGGAPLDSVVRSRVGPSLGADLSRVRVHTDHTAQSLSAGLSARAFAVGEHVAFAAGEYRPGTLAGDALIAHELAHVIQQQDATGPSRGAGTAELESDADTAAVHAVAGVWGWGHLIRNAGPRLRSGLRLRRCDCGRSSPTPAPAPAPAPTPTPAPAPAPAPPLTFVDYQNLFNSRWSTAPFAALSAGPDPAMDSRGPRTPRARAIFTDILTIEPRLRTAYDTDRAMRERMDTFTGPEGLNRIGSPRLTALQGAFTGFAKPVSVADLPALRAAVTAASLDPADRRAVEGSNEWQELINDYVTAAGERASIRAIISPPAGPTGARATPAQRTHFLATWLPQIGYWDGSRPTVYAPGRTVHYFYGGQTFTAAAVLPAPDTNPGLTLFVQSQILRGGATVFPPDPAVQFFPDLKRSSDISMPLPAPTPVPAAGDPLTFRVDIVEPAASAGPMAVAGTHSLNIPILPGSVYTQAQAEAAATVDDAFLHDATPAGLLGIMRAHGGIQRNVAEGIAAGKLRLRPLTVRHDSAVQVAAAAHGVPDPSQLAYFFGTAETAPNTSVSEAGAAGVSVGGAGSGDIVVNRTTDVATGVRRPDDEIITYTVHEATHAFDVNAGGNIEDYKTEFRAYWTDGRFGPPNSATCVGVAGDCRDATYDPAMPPPGPKSPRARAIFNNLYGNLTYRWFQNLYDNTASFREAVDNYLIPDGINLISSLRLEALRALIAGWGGAGYPAFRDSVRSFMGIGPAPPGGALDADDRHEVERNRAWRDLVERMVPPAQQPEIKSDLHIPL